MTSAFETGLLERALGRTRLQLIVDCLVVAIAVFLPWSTSVTIILIVVWLIAFLLTHNVALIRQEVETAAGFLPVLLWLLALVGMLWSEASLSERLAGLGGFHKLLVIPLLLTQFRRSERGMWVLYGFLASCTVLLVVSWFLYALWTLAPAHSIYVPLKLPGILVKDYIAQSAEFFICIFALLRVAFDRARTRHWAAAIGSALLAALFLANIMFIAPGRSALVVIPLLLVLFGFRQYGWNGVLGACVAGAILCAGVWVTSPIVRERVIFTLNDVRGYGENRDEPLTSSGIRLELWTKSLRFIAEAPIFGHGTGSITERFRRAAIETPTSMPPVFNPHNQYFAVALQLGLVGTAILIAMWLSHLALFRGSGLIAWIGTVIVLQNVVSSLFNSHLFDFLHGWLYVFCVGVLGGMMRRERRDAP